MKTELLSIDDPRWPACLAEVRHDIYHRQDYVRLDGQRMNSRPEAFLARDGQRLLFVPYLVRSCESLFPAARGVFDVVSPYGYPGMLLSDLGREAAFARAAMEALKQALRQRGACSAFLRMHPLLSDDFQQVFPAGTLTEVGETVAIDLSLDEAALWKQIRDGHQETIKKCAKAGFVPRFVPLAGVIDEFLAVYEQTMDRVRAKDEYYFPRDYFVELARMPQNVHCGVVENQETIVAACLFLECDGIVQAHLGGTASKYLSKSPFHTLLHHATLWAKSRGKRWLHLGGGVGGADDRLLRFKAGFSPTRFRFLTARLIPDEIQYRHLVQLRVASDQTPADLSFFPAYRAGS